MSISATLILFYGIGGFSNLFEVPAGAFADRYGRRLSYLIGVVCMCVGLGLWLFHLPIIVYAIARLVYCIGDALRSGTIDAMAFEEFHRHNEKEKYLNYVSHSRSFFYGVRVVTMPLGTYLFTIKPVLAIIASIISIFVSGIASLLIPDNNIMPDEHSTRTLMKETFTKIVRDKSLVLLFVAAFFLAMLSESIWRMFQPAYKSLGLNVENIGWYYAVFCLIALFASLAMNKVSRRHVLYMAFTCAFAAVAVGLAITAIFPVIIIIVFSQFVISTAFSVIEVPVPAFVQHRFEKYQQATLLSVFSMTYWGGASIGAVLVGTLLAFMSVNSAFIVLAVFAGAIALIFIPPLYLSGKRGPDSPISAEDDIVPVTLTGPDLIG